MSDPIREAQARAAEFNAQRARVAEFKRQHPIPSAPARRPEAVALEELLASLAEDFPEYLHSPRTTLALNAARNALRKGREIDAPSHRGG